MREPSATYCNYCHREYEHEPPSQWETLCHLHDCMGMPHDMKAGLFHEVMRLAIKWRAELDARGGE